MIGFQGIYLDGKSSRAIPVGVRVDAGTMVIRGRDETLRLEVVLEKCKVAPALGRTRRSILLPGGARCDTDDQDAADALERRMRVNVSMRLVAFLENRWKWAAGCLAGLIVCVWALGVYGIPLIAGVAANAVPFSALETVSLQTVQTFDQSLFKPSRLDAERDAHVRALFNTVRGEMNADLNSDFNSDFNAEFNSGFNYRLEFRKSPKIGPNAFALPDGLILMTDELVEISTGDMELIGIFRHEIAHVENLHGMRSVFQNTGVFLLISALVGDVASITSTAASIPVLLAETGYSRKFEKEADEAAGVYLLEKFGTTQSYQDILSRLEKDKSNSPGISWLSTHPGTGDRKKHMQDLEKSFEKE